MPTPREQEQFVDDIVGAIIESQVDLEEYDPGYPDIYISDDLPEGAAAVYKSTDEETPEPYMAIGTEAVDHAIRTKKPFNLVDNIIHERRHFKQDSSGVYNKETLVPPASAVSMLFIETDAYVFTAGAMQRLHANPETRWMTEIDIEQEDLGPGFQNFETYIEAPTNDIHDGRSPEQVLARLMLFHADGLHAKDQMFLDLEHKLALLKEANEIVSNFGHVNVWPNHWLARFEEDDLSTFELHPYLRTTDAFADDEGDFDWIRSEALIPTVLGEACIDDYHEIMQAMRAEYMALKGAIRLRPDEMNL